MTIYHSGLHKRKRSGGRKRLNRGRRRFEFGSPPTRTIMGDKMVLSARTSGGGLRARVLRETNANISDRSGKVIRAKILSIAENPAGVDLRRGGVMTKGAIIQTSIGRARITSRPGQSGTIDAILIEET